MRSVPLRNRQGDVVAEAFVDDEDYERVVALGPWYQGGGGYVMNSRRVNGRVITTVLHRFVLELPKGPPKVDHFDRDRLNNQRSNLRCATDGLNAQNQAPVGRANSGSGHRGVTRHTQSGKWQVRHQLHGRSHYAGLFDDLDEAVEVAKAWRAEHMPFSPEASA